MFTKYFNRFNVYLGCYTEIRQNNEGRLQYIYYYKEGGQSFRDVLAEPDLISLDMLEEKLNKYKGSGTLSFSSGGINFFGYEPRNRLYLRIDHNLEFIKELYNYENGKYKNELSELIILNKSRFLKNYDCPEFRDFLLLLTFEND